MEKFSHQRDLFEATAESSVKKVLEIPEVNGCAVLAIWDDGHTSLIGEELSRLDLVKFINHLVNNLDEKNRLAVALMIVKGETGVLEDLTN